MGKTSVNKISQVVMPDEMEFMNHSTHPMQYMWKHAYLSYFEPSSITDSRLFNNAKKVIPIHTNMDFAHIALYNDHVVISFRGTDTAEKGFLENVLVWASNLDLLPLKGESYYKRRPSDAEKLYKYFIKDGDWGKGMIHDGFYTAWMHFKPYIRDIIKKYKIDPDKTPIFVDGHSRGGALAELCSRDLAKNLGMKNTCWTFGSPAPGNIAYRDQFRLLPINGVRVVDGWDLITYIPPSIAGFEHGCARKHQFKKRLIYRFMPRQRIKDHYPSHYDKKIMGKVI